MDAGIPGGEAGQAGRVRSAAGEEDAHLNRQGWLGEESRIEATLAQTMTLMEQTAQTEQAIAETFQAMAAHDGSEAAKRRLRLAEEANAGARSAAEHGEHLLRVARRLAEHADVVRLQQLLSRASAVLEELARAEQQIAETLTRLAGRDGSDLAVQRQQAAEEAAANVQHARDQAQALHQLATTIVATMRAE